MYVLPQLSSIPSPNLPEQLLYVLYTVWKVKQFTVYTVIRTWKHASQTLFWREKPNFTDQTNVKNVIITQKMLYM